MMTHLIGSGRTATAAARTSFDLVWSTDSGILVCNDSSIDATFVASSPGAYKVGATDLQSSKPHPGQTPDVHLADFPSVASRVSQVEYWSEEAAGGRVCI